MDSPQYGATMNCPRKGSGCPGTATFGSHTFAEGDDCAFVDDATGRGPINPMETKDVWHCPSCGRYFWNKSK